MRTGTTQLFVIDHWNGGGFKNYKRKKHIAGKKAALDWETWFYTDLDRLKTNLFLGRIVAHTLSNSRIV